MIKQVAGKARFLDPIHHNEALTNFSGVKTEWQVEAILFNNDGCEYDECEEADSSFVMHDIKFADGTGCYFEVLSNGELSHFCCSAFLEFRDGVLVVSPTSVYQAQQKENGAAMRGMHMRRKIGEDFPPF